MLHAHVTKMGSVPMTRACEINQMMCMFECQYNFQPELIPVSETDVEDYFQDMPNDINDKIDNDEVYHHKFH